MSKQNLESLKRSKLKLAKTSKRLSYRQPEVYSLGSLEQVQAAQAGEDYDGPDASYYRT